MDDLVRWFTVQLDEDERIARAATGGPWRYNPDKHWRRPGTSWFEEGVFAGAPGEGAICVAGTGETDDPPSMADAAFIAEHDPARVLREIEAKREIVRQANLYLCDSGPGCGYRTKHGHSVLRLLALPYADRPGYQEEWRP